MPKIPPAVHFVYAQQAPSALNWYGQPDYEGLLLTWSPPSVPIVGHVFFRTSLRLDPSCAQDLFAGRYGDRVQTVIVAGQVDAFVDDELHDSVYYLAVARTVSGDFIALEDLTTRKLTRDDLGRLGRVRFWSNPEGTRPQGKDPRRLDYLAVAPGRFSGFSWSYPDDLPDVAGYDLIVSRQPITAESADDQDIAQFDRVLAGQMGASHAIDPHITAIVDNASEEGQFRYFALLARDGHGGRRQLPLTHHDEPFFGQRDFKYLIEEDGFVGSGLETMQAAFQVWRAQRVAAAEPEPAARPAASPAARPSSGATSKYAPPGGASPRASSGGAGEGVAWATMSPRRALNAAYYAEEPSLLGLQIQWRGPEGDEETRFVALRAPKALEEDQLAPLLRGDAPLPDGCARVAFRGPARKLVDVSCDDCTWYCMAWLEGDELRAVERLSSLPLKRFPRFHRSTVYWPCPGGEVLHDRLIHHVETERVRREGADPVVLELGVSDQLEVPTAIELYRFHEVGDWIEASAEQRAAFHALQRGEASSIGEMVRLPGDVTTVLDDLIPLDGRGFVGAAALDEANNRFPIQVFSAPYEPEIAAPRLSELTGRAPAGAASQGDLPVAEDDDLPVPADDLPVAEDDDPLVAEDDDLPVAEDDDLPVAEDDDLPVAEDDDLPVPVDDDLPVAEVASLATSTSRPLTAPTLVARREQALRDGVEGHRAVAFDEQVDLDDQVGLSTSDELQALGYDPDEPSLDTTILPDLDEAAGPDTGEFTARGLEALEDATPSSPITGVTALLERVAPESLLEGPGGGATAPAPVASDVRWQRAEQTRSFNRLSWSGDASPGARVWLLWAEVDASAEAGPPVTWSALDAWVDGALPEGIRALASDGGPGRVLDNLTRAAAWLARVERDSAGQWRQLALTIEAPPWSEPSLPPLLDPTGMRRVDARVAERLREARASLRARRPEEARGALDQARLVWSDNVRILAFERAHAGDLGQAS